MTAQSRQASALQRYGWRSLVLMLVFVGLLILIDKRFDPAANDWPASRAWPLVVLTCLPLLAYGWEVVRYVRSIDEMMARFQLRAAAMAMLVMLFAAAFLGVAEIYGLMEPLNMTMLLPIAAAAHSVAAMIQQVRAR